jgi:2-polyprenyl-6-methoxyphenol hydroxylase-like FAD-dependent oxidoreductase
MAGSRIVVIDGALAGPTPPPPGTYSNRCTALTPTSTDFLQQIGVWPHVQQLHHHPYQSMQVWDACGSGNIWLDATEVGKEHMGTLVMNDVLQAAVLTQLEGCANVRFVRGVSVAAASFGSYATPTDRNTMHSEGEGKEVAVAAAAEEGGGGGNNN